MAEIRQPFLNQEHWRQVLTIVAPILLAFLGFLGIVWSDHGQLARNTTDIEAIGTAVRQLQQDDVLLKAGGQVQAGTNAALTAQIHDLSTGVSNLTLAVQKLTDLLPENRRQ